MTVRFVLDLGIRSYVVEPPGGSLALDSTPFLVPIRSNLYCHLPLYTTVIIIYHLNWMLFSGLCAAYPRTHRFLFSE